VNYAGLAYINTVNASSDCFGEANGSGKGAKLCKRGLLARLKSPAGFMLPICFLVNPCRNGAKDWTWVSC
jgi:hypothetical protein